MIFHLCILGVAFAATPSSRPILKKIEHLKRAAPAMINLYFVDAIPDGNNAAHAVGTLKNLSRRTRVAERLNVNAAPNLAGLGLIPAVPE